MRWDAAARIWRRLSNVDVIIAAKELCAVDPGFACTTTRRTARPTGIGLVAKRDGDEYILDGRKYWPCNVAGWDGKGANASIVVVRTDPDTGGQPAHYLDQHGYHGELIGAMCKVHCTELLFEAVYKCMQVVGVNSADKQHMFEKYLREAAIFPIYDAGNFGMSAGGSMA